VDDHRFKTYARRQNRIILNFMLFTTKYSSYQIPRFYYYVGKHLCAYVGIGLYAGGCIDIAKLQRGKTQFSLMLTTKGSYGKLY
jgi:hypothetical protein